MKLKCLVIVLQVIFFWPCVHSFDGKINDTKMLSSFTQPHYDRRGCPTVLCIILEQKLLKKWPSYFCLIKKNPKTKQSKSQVISVTHQYILLFINSTSFLLTIKKVVVKRIGKQLFSKLIFWLEKSWISFVCFSFFFRCQFFGQLFSNLGNFPE